MYLLSILCIFRAFNDFIAFLFNRLVATGVMIGCSLIFMSISMNSFYPFMFLFASGFGLCNALTYMVPMHHGWLWFPKYPGLVSGIIVGGFGVGTLIFSLVCTALVNPDNLGQEDGKFPDSVNERVPHMLVIWTVCRVCIAIASIILIFPGNDLTNSKELQDAISRRSLSQAPSL